MKEDLIVIIMGIGFLYTGIQCSFKPYKMQKNVLDYYDAHEYLKKLNPLLPWMRTRNYILALRIGGVLSFLGFFIALYVIICDIVK